MAVRTAVQQTALNAFIGAGFSPEQSETILNQIIALSAGAVTTGDLTVLGNLTFTPIDKTANFSPTGTGTVTINPATAGTINAMSIGATTRGSGAFTTLTANAAVTFSPANANVVLSPTGTGIVTINPATVGSLNNVVIGGATPASGTFTALAATTLSVAGASLGTFALASTTGYFSGGISQGTTTASTGGIVTAGAISQNFTSTTAIWYGSGTAYFGGFGADGSTYPAMKWAQFTNSGTERDILAVDASGNVQIGAATPATNATTNLMQIPVTAGTPTGAVTNGTFLGDSSGSKLWIRLGGSWKSVAVA